ncbi:MAG: LexA family transcriptional regulator [Bacteroidota bacterium]
MSQIVTTPIALPLTGSLHARFRSARKEANISRDDLAAALGVSYKTIQNYETGNTRPGLEALQRLASMAGVEVTDLLPGNAEGPGEAVEPGVSLGNGTVPVPQYGHVGAGDGRVPPKQIGVLHVTPAEYALDFAEPPRVITTEIGDRYAPAERFGYFIVDGDSAAPVFFDRERVPVQLLDPEKSFANDLLFVFRWAGEYQLKRLRRLPGGVIRATSLNPGIEPFEFRLADEEDFAVVALARVSQKQQIYTALVGRFLRAEGYGSMK